MRALDVSNEVSEFEVPAELDEGGRLRESCARQVREVFDDHGFVVITNVLSDAETAVGLDIVRDGIADPRREMGTFASQTDIKYGRRDFTPLPSTQATLSYAATLCKRVDKALLPYCDRTRLVLEISTLTSYLGSSHQYLHRDPSGVICLFAVLHDVSPTQGGTLFVPGTHTSDHAGDAAAIAPAHQFQARVNFQILGCNLAKLWRLRRQRPPLIHWTELRDRTFSRRYDNHQPNLLHFLACRNPVFNVSMIGPRTLAAAVFKHTSAEAKFRLVQVAPAKGTVILYRSEMLHAGPDNRSTAPRYFFSMSVARTDVGPKQWRAGYSPHSSLLAEPKTLGDLLDLPT